jgi:ParB family chromosome partitioning protein
MAALGAAQRLTAHHDEGPAHRRGLAAFAAVSTARATVTPMTEPSTAAGGTTADIAPVHAIRIGERDRTELGDLTELADSIAAVGLLHPIVVTANLDLVAGGRRLTAVKQLGWTEVPVTVVDWFTAEQALRAEADENTCRKPLSPLEASRMRERRIKVLTEASVIRKPGRPANVEEPTEGQGSIWGKPGSGPENGSNLDPFPSRGTTAAKARKVGAQTTGYSGSSIDKVDEIRQIAERGTRTVGSGSAKREEPVPEAVREVARQQLPALAQTGAAIEPARQAVKRALDQHIEKDPAIQLAEVLRNLAAASVKVREFTTLDTERCAQALNAQQDSVRRWEELDRLRSAVDEWFTSIDQLRPRPGLRLAGGVR